MSTDTDRLQDDLADAPVEHLREICMVDLRRGALWKPHVEASFSCRPLAGIEFRIGQWYWRDLEESPRDQWRGPFANEGAALIDAIKENGVDNAVHQ